MFRKNNLKVIGAVSVIVLFVNLNALVDLVVHPEIPYFHKEHLIVGGITGIIMILLFILLVFYIKHLNKAMKRNAQLDKDRQRAIAEMKLTLWNSNQFTIRRLLGYAFLITNYILFASTNAWQS